MQLRRIAIFLIFGMFVTCLALDMCYAWDKGAISGIVADFDTSIAPGDNFFLYVNGNWLKKNPIPPEHSGWGVDIKLQDSVADSLHHILSDLTKAPEPKDATVRKLLDFYTTAMNTAAINKQGIAPLQSELERIANLQSIDEVMAEAGHLRRLGIVALGNFSISQDEKQSDRYAALIARWNGFARKGLLSCFG